MRFAIPFCRCKEFSARGDGPRAKAAHQSDADRDGDRVRRLVAAPEHRQPAERRQRKHRRLALLQLVLFHGARDRHELHLLQPLPLRLAQRKLPQGIQTG